MINLRKILITVADTVLVMCDEEKICTLTIEVENGS